MKYLKRLIPVMLSAVVLFFSACGQTGQSDADAMFREAKSSAYKIKSCVSTVESVLSFTANGTPYSFRSSGELTYHATPFALKSKQTAENSGKTNKTETYTVSQNDTINFYCKTDGEWQKADVSDMDTAVSAQINMVKLMNEAKVQRYIRKTTLESKTVHKIELLFQKDVLQSTIETIVTATGMANGSKTIVHTLMDSASPVYGYCYIDTETGQPVRIELDLTETIHDIFNKIDGGSVDIHVSECSLTENLQKIDSAPGITLPADAADASSVQALG